MEILTMQLSDIYVDYHDNLYRYALSLTGNPDDAEDLTQETLTRGCANFELLKILKPHKRRSWLFRVLKNAFIDCYNKKKRERLYLENFTEKHENPLFDRVDLEIMLNDLPEKYAQILRMRYFNNLNSSEMGRILNLPQATVRSRIRLALKQLKNLI